MQVCVLEHPRIRSEKRFNDIANTPLWSCLMGGYVTSSLEMSGVDVVYWDAVREGWDFNATKEAVINLSPELLCINTVYIWEHTDQVFAFFSALREEGYKGHIHLFGFFPTLAWKQILEHTPHVDSVSVGECETTIVSLAATIENGLSFSRIPGLAYRQAMGTHVVLKKRPSEGDPDIFPFPKRTQEITETVAILSSRGCYNHCSFCPIPSFYNQGPLWRGRNTDLVAEEMASLVSEGFRDFYFVDPNFIGPGNRGKERMIRLMKKIRPLNITFGMETRPEDLDGEIIDHLVASGFQSLLLGIESGSGRVLQHLDKHTKPEISGKAIRLCRAAGIEPEIGFLMFVPDSTLADLRCNLDFLAELDLLNRLDRTVNLLSHCQIVFMGTSGYGMFERLGRLKPSGFMGFEGIISYADPVVQQIANIVVRSCHVVLRKMEAPDLSIYWKNSPDSRAHQQVNQYLVTLFHRLIDEASTKNLSLDIDDYLKDIERELDALIS